MKYILSVFCIFFATWSFAETKFPQPIPITPEEAMWRTEVNIRTIPKKKSPTTTMPSHINHAFPDPIQMTPDEALFPAIYSNQPPPLYWHQQQRLYAAAVQRQWFATWRQEQAYYARIYAPSSRPEPTPMPTPIPIPTPTVTPTPISTPTPVSVITLTPLSGRVHGTISTTTKDNADLQLLYQQQEEAYKDLIKTISLAVPFILLGIGVHIYLFRQQRKNHDRNQS